ncbi:MAG: hypothetical protein ABEJ07_01570 [Candidatus Nanohaloarchaea archaeon]
MSNSKEFFDSIEDSLEERRAGDMQGTEEILERTPYEQFGLSYEEAASYVDEVRNSNWRDRFEDMEDAVYRRLLQEETGADERTDSPKAPQSPTTPF